MTMVKVQGLSYTLRKGKQILKDISFQVDKGSCVAVVGENGAGKTTLLDILMGFKEPTEGIVSVMGQDPWLDPWKTRERIAYLSEKIDFPGDWTVKTLLEFNRVFYSHYSAEMEKKLVDFFRVDLQNRIGNLSAGEIRRAQVIGALSYNAELIIVDEVTAVLDIVGRRKFMATLQEMRHNGSTVILASNIPEGLELYATHVLLLSRGRLQDFTTMDAFLSKKSHTSFANLVGEMLEGT